MHRERKGRGAPCPSGTQATSNSGVRDADAAECQGAFNTVHEAGGVARPRRRPQAMPRGAGAVREAGHESVYEPEAVPLAGTHRLPQGPVFESGSRVGGH